MIRYEKGNILESSAIALVNTVNTEGVMGKGLALQFKEAFPLNYKLYREACLSGNFDVGQVLIFEDSNEKYGSHLIVNFPTKTTWRKPSKYEFISSGLEALRSEIEKRNISSIAIPPLGTHNGGLQWEKVKGMIHESLCNLNCDVIVYEPSEGIHEKMLMEKVKLTPARALLLDVLYSIVAQGEFVSEFTAEKTTYFLQRFGARDVFKLEFYKAPYGPYSGKVRHLLHRLNGSYLKGMSDLSNHPFDPIEITPSAADFVSDYLKLKKNAPYREISSMVKSFLKGFCSNYGMELLATVDFILQSDEQFLGWQQRNVNDVSEGIQMQLARWNDRKQKLFNDKHNVCVALEHIKKYTIWMENPLSLGEKRSCPEC